MPLLQSSESKQAMTALQNSHGITPLSLPVQPALLDDDTATPFGAASEDVATAVTQAVLQYIMHVILTWTLEIEGPQQRDESIFRCLCDGRVTLQDVPSHCAVAIVHSGRWLLCDTGLVREYLRCSN